MSLYVALNVPRFGKVAGGANADPRLRAIGGDAGEGQGVGAGQRGKRGIVPPEPLGVSGGDPFEGPGGTSISLSGSVKSAFRCFHIGH